MPTKRDVEKVVRLIAKGAANYEYFFSKLNDSSWIKPLDTHGLFRDPPPAARDSSNLVIGASWWSPSKYLVRVTQNAPDEVLKIALKIKTDNYFIMSDFTEAALQMPILLAVKWAEHIQKWLNNGNQIHGFLAENIGKLISKLAKEGKPDVGLRLAADLLYVLPDPEAEAKSNPKSEVERILHSSLVPSIRCDRYNYEQVLKVNIPDLANAAPFETLALLCKLLEKAVLYSLPEGDAAKPHDATYIWRPAIEDHEQNTDYNSRADCPLIMAVRDTAEKICKNNPEKTGEVVLKIEGYGWDVFRRIGLHLLRLTDKPPVAMVEAHLVNEANFNHPGLYHEYYHLLRDRFAELTPGGKNTILGWIEDASQEKKFLAKHGEDLSKEQKYKRIRYWKFRILSAIKSDLLGALRGEYNALSVEFKEADMPPDLHTYVGRATFSKPKSPRKTEQLAQMRPDKLIAFLKTWKATGKWDDPTPDGLGSALCALVADHPNQYAAMIEQFIDAGIGPTYIRHIISGFCRALEGGKKLPFLPVFKLCKWVVDRPIEIPGRIIPKQPRDGLVADTTWRNARSEIARLLERALDEKTKLPFEFRDEVWAIIRPLTDDPEPDAAYEKKYGGGNMDPLTMSLNTVRGKALHAVMYYALWVYRNRKDEIKARESRTPGFTDMSEVLEVFERHIDPAVDSSQTSRAMYGQWLPQLVHLGPEWVFSSLSRIFPREPNLKPLRDAVWHTYLLYGGQIYSHVVRTLKDIYREEVQNLKDKRIGDKTYKSPETRLAEHVVILYLWGEYGLETDSLIDLFYRTAPPQLTAHAMDFIGRDTCGAEKSEPAIVERMKSLWEWRVNLVGDYDKMPKEELSSFGWWFAGGQFESAWAFAQLEEVLKRTGVSRASMKVFERMSDIFSDYPQESLRCLKLFLDKNDDPWFFRSTRKQKGVWTTLEQALAFQDADIRDKGEEIVHMLGAMGYLEYRELLKKQEPKKA